MIVLKKGKADRVPWAPLVDNYFVRSLPNQGYNMDEIEIIKHIGGDILFRHANVHNAIYKNVEIETTKKGNETFSIMKTPVGSVTTQNKRLAG